MKEIEKPIESLIENLELKIEKIIDISDIPREEMTFSLFKHLLKTPCPDLSKLFGKNKLPVFGE